MSYKPEYCHECAKRMGEEPDLQKERMLFYFIKNSTNEYKCPVCKNKTWIAWLPHEQTSDETADKVNENE